MTINPPRAVRLAVYVLTILGTPLVAYLNAKGILGALEVTLWSAEVSAAGLLAALNTTSRTEATVTVDAPADVDVRLDERGASDVVTIAAVLVIVCAVVWLVLVAR